MVHWNMKWIEDETPGSTNENTGRRSSLSFCLYILSTLHLLSKIERTSQTYSENIHIFQYLETSSAQIVGTSYIFVTQRFQ